MHARTHACTCTHSVEHTSGVVVDVGHGVMTCVAVWEGEECPTPLSCDPLECTAAKVAELVHSVVTKCSEETQPILRERVVVTGEREILVAMHPHSLFSLPPSLPPPFPISLPLSFSLSLSSLSLSPSLSLSLSLSPLLPSHRWKGSQCKFS